MNYSKFRYFLILIPLILILSFSGPDNRLLAIARNIEIFGSVMKELDKFYVEDIDPKKLVENALKGLLEGMDPYSKFYPEEEMDEYLMMTTGKYEGVGLVLEIVDKKFFVFDIEEESPAEKANIHIGDEITEVNDQAIKGLSQSEVNKLMGGESGSTLTLAVKSIFNQKISKVSLIRNTIQLKNIQFYQLLDNQIGYIYLKEFNLEAAQEFKAAFLDLKKQGMQKLVVDLSSNPGGLMNQAITISNYFLPKNRLVVSTKGKRPEWNNAYSTLSNPLDEHIPLAIIIDKNTASAAEIFAGVMQEYDRAIIIGQKSFGKGLVQITRDLPYRTKLKMTTARYYLPSGRCIQKIDYFNSKEADTNKVYQTKAGRILTNNGGINPDIKTNSTLYQPFFQFLVEEDMFFNYSLEEFKNIKDSIKLSNWTVSDFRVKDFISWVKVQKKQYESPEKQFLDTLYARTQDQPNLESWRENIKKLSMDSRLGFETSVESNKAEIKQFVSYLLIAEKHSKKIADSWNLPHRKEIKLAKEILSNSNQYKGYLSPK